MKRRGFLKGILATGCAPFVITSAGVLMQVRDIWKPTFAWLWLITVDEFGTHRVPTDLDKRVEFDLDTKIVRVEAHVPGIGLMPVHTKGSHWWSPLGGYEMTRDSGFTLDSPKENHIRINEHHAIPNPLHREYPYWQAYWGKGMVLV
jgi:hypothetical protein